MAVVRYFTGLFRRFRSFVLRREVEVIGQCRLCGNCCRDILIRDKGRWLSSSAAFERLSRKEPEFARFRITGRDESGALVFACSMQGEDNFCTCYEDRLPLCKTYPSKSLYYQGGWLRSDCGFSYKATTFSDVFNRRKRGRIPKFSDVLQKECNRTHNKERTP